MYYGIVWCDVTIKDIKIVQGGPNKVTPYGFLLIFWPKVKIFKIKFQSFEGNLYVRIMTKFY